MKKLIYTIPVALVLMATPTNLLANEKADALIKEYVNAFQNKNHEVLGDAWNKIKDDPQALNYIKENYKYEYTLLNYQRLHNRIDRIEDQYGLSGAGVNQGYRSTAPRVAFPRSRPETRPQTESSSQRKRSNRTRATQSPNKQRRRNKQRSDLSNSRNKRTNQDQVKSFSNQERVRKQSNQKRIRDRLRRRR